MTCLAITATTEKDTLKDDQTMHIQKRKTNQKLKEICDGYVLTNE